MKKRSRGHPHPERQGPVYVFGEAGVEMRETTAATLEEALRETNQN